MAMGAGYSTLTSGAGASAGGLSGAGAVGMAGIGLGLGASIGGAFSQMMAADYNAKIAELNAQVAEIQARDAIASGNIAARRHMQNVTQMIGSQRAILAAHGQDLDEETALKIQTDTAKLGALDAQMIRNNAARAAWGYRVGAVNSRAQGAMGQYQAMLGATGSVLEGAGRAAYGYSAIKGVS